MARRFYYPHLNPTDQEIRLSGPEARHLRVVLRTQPGDVISLFDGQGAEAQGTVIQVDGEDLLVQVENWQKVDREVACEIHLGICLPKEAAWDLSLRGAVELGARSITPLISRRSRPMPPSPWEKKLTRWQKIIEGAGKQCGGNTLPHLGSFTPLRDFAQENSHPLTLVALPNSPLATVQFPVLDLSQVAVIIGPEGGFDPQEIVMFTQANCTPFGLGQRILRVETAVISTLATIFYAFSQ